MTEKNINTKNESNTQSTDNELDHVINRIANATADKMMRMGGRDYLSGSAKAVNVDETGNIGTHSYMRTERIVNSPETVTSGSVFTKHINPIGLFTVGGRVNTESEHIRLKIDPFMGGTYEASEFEYIPIKNGRFITKVHLAKYSSARINIATVGGKSIEITHLYINSATAPTDENFLENHLDGKVREYSVPIPSNPELKVGERVELEIEAYPSTSIGIRLDDDTDVSVSYANLVQHIYLEEEFLGEYETTQKRIITRHFTPKTRDIKLIIENIGNTDTFLTDVNVFGSAGGGGGGSTGSGLSVKDLSGNDVPLTAVLDDEGNAVLRMVNAAPQAYDVGNDALRTVNIDDTFNKPHTTYELIWSDSDLVNEKIFKINLNGRHDFLRGEKAAIVYQNVEDGHSIYIETKIGVSGEPLKQYIVKDGEGASRANGKTTRHEFPSDLFPIIDFTGTRFPDSDSNLVFETVDGDLSDLRAYLVIM